MDDELDEEDEVRRSSKRFKKVKLNETEHCFEVPQPLAKSSF